MQSQKNIKLYIFLLIQIGSYPHMICLVWSVLGLEYGDCRTVRNNIEHNQLQNGIINTVII